VGTFVTPGSHIVIYDTYQPPVGPAGAPGATKQTRVLLDDALVIAVGSTSLTPAANANADGQGQASGALVTVALPPDAAAKLVHGIQTGTLYAGLRSIDTRANLAQIISDATLFNN